MQDWLSTILIVGSLISATLAFIWVALRLGNPAAAEEDKTDSYASAADIEVEHIFNDEFREELRNRGRLHFEKIIGENAMFLQQDLRLTTSQVNEYMKQEITKTLQDAFVKYEETIQDAKDQALESISKTQVAVEQQRELMEKQLKEVMEQEKKRIVERFENNMADIVNHYVLNAIGNQISLDDQLEYILAELESNKKDMVKDIESGA
ncbi:hypothetical protein HZB74_02170 [Candidatus Saccharibacteria bacterium]|nr:hypothetical protein [Candidatus Saccharibacteria bacterium]